MENLKKIVGNEIFDTHIKPKLQEGKSYFFGEGDFIPKGRFDEVNNQVKDYKTQVTDRDKQLEDLKKNVKGNEELTKQLEALQTTNKTQKDEYEAKLQKQEYDFAYKTELSKVKAKDLDILGAKIDNTKIVYKDGKFSGLNEQIDALKKSHPYIFEDEKLVPPRVGNQINAGNFQQNGQQQQQPTNVKPWNKPKI